jgi:hypothetical protein
MIAILGAILKVIELFWRIEGKKPGYRKISAALMKLSG